MAWTALALVAITLPLRQAIAAPVVIQCPESISVTEKAQASYAPWEFAADKGKVDVHLQSMLLYDGHPREMASLVPDRTDKKGGQLIATWRLVKLEADRGYWVGCAYRNSMTLLTQRLPEGLSSCRYTQKIVGSGTLAGVESFICE